jgi:hypothetical protein
MVIPVKTLAKRMKTIQVSLLLGPNILISTTATPASTTSPVNPPEMRSVAMTGGSGLRTTLEPMIRQKPGRRLKIQIGVTQIALHLL